MGNPKDEIKHESLQDCESIVKYLIAIREGFEKGQITLSSKDNHIMLVPENPVKLKVKASRKNEQVKISLKFEWKENKQKSQKSEPLHIDSSLE